MTGDWWRSLKVSSSDFLERYANWNDEVDAKWDTMRFYHAFD